MEVGVEFASQAKLYQSRRDVMCEGLVRMGWSVENENRIRQGLKQMRRVLSEMEKEQLPV